MTPWGKIKTVIVSASVLNIFIMFEMKFPSSIAIYLFGLIAPILIVSGLMIMNKSQWVNIKQPSWNDRLFNRSNRTYTLSETYFFGIWLLCLSCSFFINASIIQHSNWKIALFFLLSAIGFLIATKFWAQYILKPRKPKPKPSSKPTEDNPDEVDDFEVF